MYNALLNFILIFIQGDLVIMKKIFSMILGLSVFGISTMFNVFASPRTWRKFEPWEDLLIKEFVQENGTGDWTKIPSRLKENGRTPRQCRERYEMHLKETDGEKVPWTEEHDRLLEEKVQRYGHNWKIISQFFPGYTPIQIQYKYRAIDDRKWGQPYHRFEPEEDQQIIQYVDENGTGDWKVIANQLGVTVKQCSGRYHKNLKKVPGPQVLWTEEQDKLLDDYIQEYGPSWTMFTEFFPGYSVNDLMQKGLHHYPPRPPQPPRKRHMLIGDPRMLRIRRMPVEICRMVGENEPLYAVYIKEEQ